MEIVVYDTLAAMRAVLEASPPQRWELYRRQMIEPLRSYWAPIMQSFGPDNSVDDDALRPLLWNVDLAGDTTLHLAALDRLERAHAWDVVAEAIRTAARAFAHRAILPERIECVLTLGDPNDAYFMH
jgi:hypothetical protein